MYKSLLTIVLISVSLLALAGNGGHSSRNTVIIMKSQARQIARITRHSIVLISGTTYRYTVDTPEDKGLVSTGADVKELLLQIRSKDGSAQQYAVTSKEGPVKTGGDLVAGDRLVVTAEDGKTTRSYLIGFRPMALAGLLRLEKEAITANVPASLALYYTIGQRSPDATVRIYLPAGMQPTLDNTTVNVIGRGEVKLKDLPAQSIGRVGSKYSYSRIGEVSIIGTPKGGIVLKFTHLDLRPENGADLKIVIHGVKLSRTGQHVFRASYTTAQPQVLTSPGTGSETASLLVTRTISSLERVVDRDLSYGESADRYTKVCFRWNTGLKTPGIRLCQSTDQGKTWIKAKAALDITKGVASVTGLDPQRLYTFRLYVPEGQQKGYSNMVRFYSGKMDIKSFGVSGDGIADATQKVNEAIDSLSSIGGGTLLFSAGTYPVRTIHLKSDVFLYLDKGATIKALQGGDAPEATWFSDKKYRSGLSPTDAGPYEDPENWLTKQDVGHHYFRNCMFFGERLDNVKIIGNGRITGDGNLVTGDRVMNNAPDNRSDKMFTFKLCTNIEIGGLRREEDLWYDPARDEPYYIAKDGSRLTDTDMLQIDRGGHFALLATGTDGIHVHDTYFGKENQSNARDIYDFMACNDVTVTNIYSKLSSDDIVKPGSDCSLGFTRPARHYRVRNVIGDTNCNLFQIGSETADDIMDVCVDNIYVLGANKAGFSISTNDGAHIKDIHLNCGHTGPLHSRSVMYRTFAPFFISISNRGRVLGAEVGKYSFTENGVDHNELLVKNINIGKVENIILNGIDVFEVYAGSSFGGTRWKPYDGSQKKATAIVAGYALPDPAQVKGGLDFRLPDGRHTGYISHIEFRDVHILVKGGNPLSDTARVPPELGVGQYNISNLGVQPSYGLWARHVRGLTVRECSFNYEKRDSRYALFLDDVHGALLRKVKMVRPLDNPLVVGQKQSSEVTLEQVLYYDDIWGHASLELKEGRASYENQRSGK